MTDKTREDFEVWGESAVEAMKQAHTHLMFAAACNGVTVLDSVGAQETCEALHEAVEGLKSVKAATQHSAARIAELEAEVQALRMDAAPIPAHELVTMYDERPTSDLEMIDFAREVERRHGIGVQPQHITSGSPCWCNPDVAYTDPETGASVTVHRRPQ